MKMMDAVRNGFERYAQFSGRATRPEFWWWVLFTGLVGAVLGGIPLGTAGMPMGMVHSASNLGTVWDLVVLVPTLAVAVRRLRDAGFGWAQLFWLLIPGVGLIIVAILCARPTTAQPMDSSTIRKPADIGRSSRIGE